MPHVEITDEGFNENGQLIGPAYVDGEPVNNGRWITLAEAIQIASSIDDVDIL